MEVATVHAALDVLRAIVSHHEPDPRQIQLLRQASGPDAEFLPADTLARTVVERYLSESKLRLKARCAGSGSSPAA